MRVTRLRSLAFVGFVVSFCILALLAPSRTLRTAIAEAPARAFTPEQRGRIDDHALWSPRERLNTGKVEAAGSVIEWLVVHAPIPPDEEQRRSAEGLRQFESKQPLTEPPAPAAAMLKMLLEHLPPSLKPTKDPIRLATTPELKQNAQLVGNATIVVNREWLDTTLAVENSGREQVAFVLARQLGHAGLGHVRRRLQRAWIEDELRRGAERKSSDLERTLRFLQNLSGVQSILEYVYTREEEYQADLFALHLCRNAGLDVERCLDALRGEAIERDPQMLQEPLARTGQPPIEPEIQPQTGPEALSLAAPPTPAHRLRRLRLELDGQLGNARFGLLEFDRATKAFRRAESASVPEGTRAVVCIHGMESSAEVFRALLEQGLDQQDLAGVRWFVFQYPADDSLARSGKALERELRRVFASARTIDVVGHSAGGLVFRYYAEVLGGEFQSAVFLGTPHQGSNLARLRRLLEAVQFLGDLKLGYDEALRNAIVDGRGQMTFDLTPDSLFLNYLNRPRENLHRDRYAIHRGRVLSRTKSFLLQSSLEAARVTLVRRLERQEESALTRLATSASSAIAMPPEIADGDLCVESASALLDGVSEVSTHTLTHTALPRDTEVIRLILERWAKRR